MEAAATCKYYVTKLLGIGPPKPNCVYDVRSGDVHDREQKSLFRVFYRANGRRRRKHRHRGADDGGGGGARPVVESYARSAHADEAGARIGDGRRGGRALEDDTVEDIEKKFLGFRNVFEKCKVKKKKKPPRLFNVTTGLRFTLVANTMLHMDDQKNACGGGDGDEPTCAAAGPGRGERAGVVGAVRGAVQEGVEDDVEEEEEEEEEEVDEADGEEDDEEDDGEEDGAVGRDGVGGGGDDGDDGDDEEGSVYDGIVGARQPAVGFGEAGTSESCSKCPKDVADKVNSWIDSSAKQTEYSEEEGIFVGDENIQPHGAVLKCGDRLHIVKGGT